MSAEQEFEPAILLAQIAAATEQVLESAARLSDADAREPSLLPGWSRGHVLTHLARNADGGSRLLTWARTGVETREYPSMEARAAQIEAGADRSAADLVADVRESAAEFASQYARMPSQVWRNMVRWTGGQQHPAARIADSRLGEVLIHHVDLRAGYTPAQWPVAFIQDMLGKVAAVFASRGDAHAMRLHATDSEKDGDAWYEVGIGGSALEIHGTRGSLLAWLMGRSAGADLTTRRDVALPRLPFLY